MTKYETSSLIASILALIISIVSPIVSYFWLDTSEKEYKNRGRFVIVKYTEDEKNQSFSVVVRNVGDRPAESVQLGMVYRGTPPDDSVLSFSPAVPNERKADKNAVFYTLSRAVAPKDLLEISAKEPILGMTLYTKYGDSLAVPLITGSTGSGW